MQSPYKKGGRLALAAIVTGAALPAAGGAEASSHAECVAPDVVGVSLAEARRTLRGSGCGVTIRQLPAHGRYVTPPSPDARQLVGRQRPSAGAHSQAVTVWVKPLCAQSALPGPDRVGPEQHKGPTELVAGLYLAGGPLRMTPHCRKALPEAGTVTVSTPSGTVIARRSVRDGRFAIFPLAPGSYVLDGALAGGSGSARAAFPQTAFTIAARRTTSVNLVASVP